MMAGTSDAPSMGRIQKRKTNLSKSSLSACNARPVHTDGPYPVLLPGQPEFFRTEPRFFSLKFAAAIFVPRD